MVVARIGFPLVYGLVGGLDVWLGGRAPKPLGGHGAFEFIVYSHLYCWEV